LKLPSLLIIGAQKSGTTTLYRDLLTQPGVYFPYVKEPTALGDDRVLTPEGLAEYAGLYKASSDTDVRGDASTGYARIPKFKNVPQRALRVLGPDIKLIYIIREPISRIVSHHHHILTNLPCAPLVDDFIHEAEHHTLEFTRYAMQFKAWLEHYPIDQTRVLIFEEYTKRRREVVQELGGFLGFHATPELVNPDARFNTAADRSRDGGWVMRFQRTDLYSRLRPLMSAGTRDFLRRALTPKAPPPPPPPRAETVDELLDLLEGDQRELARVLDRPYPIWDPQQVRVKYAKLREKSGATPAPDSGA
jgi:hypothetical protein